MDLIGVCMPKIRSISAAVKEEYSTLEISANDDDDDDDADDDADDDDDDNDAAGQYLIP